MSDYQEITLGVLLIVGLLLIFVVAEVLHIAELLEKELKSTINHVTYASGYGTLSNREFQAVEWILHQIEDNVSGFLELACSNRHDREAIVTLRKILKVHTKRSLDICKSGYSVVSINDRGIKDACRILIDNGIDRSDAEDVLQAIGYALIDTELFPEEGR